MKNIVRRLWRRRGSAVRAITAEEKARLRAAILQPVFFQQTDKTLAVQLAVLVSKVARHDWPRAWPELFPTLLAIAQSTDPVQVLFTC